MRPRLLVICFAAAVAGGCGSRASLDPKVESAYVDAQAHALCLVQTKAFATLAALHTAYTNALKASGLSADDLAAAQEAQEKDVDLRLRVSDKVVALCGGAK